MLTHDFGQIKTSFEKSLKYMMFDDVLDKRERFLDYENNLVQKFEISSKFIFPSQMH